MFDFKFWYIVVFNKWVVTKFGTLPPHFFMIYPAFVLSFHWSYLPTNQNVNYICSIHFTNILSVPKEIPYESIFYGQLKENVILKENIIHAS